MIESRSKLCKLSEQGPCNGTLYKSRSKLCKLQSHLLPLHGKALRKGEPRFAIWQSVSVPWSQEKNDLILMQFGFSLHHAEACRNVKPSRCGKVQ